MDENQLYYYKMDHAERAERNSLKPQIYEDSFEHHSGY